LIVKKKSDSKDHRFKTFKYS